jgi:hypothetical protein
MTQLQFCLWTGHATPCNNIICTRTITKYCGKYKVMYIAQLGLGNMVARCWTDVAGVWDICRLLPSRHGKCGPPQRYAAVKKSICLFMNIFTNTAPCNMAHVLTLVTCIQQFPGLSLGWDTDYTHWGFSWFSPVPEGKCWDTTSY